MPKSFLRQARTLFRTPAVQNVDNGNGTTADQVLFNSGPTGVRLLRVYALYATEQAGTIAAANFKLGVAAGGATLVGATAYENSKAIGATTEGTILVDVVAPNTTVWVRHTGVASSAAGEVYYCVEFVYDE